MSVRTPMEQGKQPGTSSVLLYINLTTISHNIGARQTPHHLSCSDLRRAQNTGPTEPVPLRTTRVPEPERLGPGSSAQGRPLIVPGGTTYSPSSVGREATRAVSGGRPSVAEAWRAHVQTPPSQGSCLAGRMLLHGWAAWALGCSAGNNQRPALG